MSVIRYSNASSQTGFRSALPLTNDQIGRYAPSILATEPHASRGERYAYIPTVEVLDGLRREGFHPFEVRQTKVKDLSRRDFTKHLIRLRHASHIESRVNEEVPEIVLVNSHDGTSSFQLLAGIFRLVCSNGLIAGDICSDIRVRHTGRVVDNVIEGSYRVLDNIQQVQSRIGDYKGTLLTPGEQAAFAEAALDLRYDRDEAGNSLAPIDAGRLVNAVRVEDGAGYNGNRDLWRTFNVVQEHLVRGGIAGRSASGRRIRTRAITGVNEDLRLNRALWTLADRLAQAKQPH